MNDRYSRFGNRGNTQGGKKEPQKKENSEKNGADFISIVHRILPDSHGGNIYGKMEDWKRMLNQMVERINWDLERLKEGGDKE